MPLRIRSLRAPTWLMIPIIRPLPATARARPSPVAGCRDSNSRQCWSSPPAQNKPQDVIELHATQWCAGWHRSGSTGQLPWPSTPLRRSVHPSSVDAWKRLKGIHESISSFPIGCRPCISNESQTEKLFLMYEINRAPSSLSVDGFVLT